MEMYKDLLIKNVNAESASERRRRVCSSTTQPFSLSHFMINFKFPMFFRFARRCRMAFLCSFMSFNGRAWCGSERNSRFMLCRASSLGEISRRFAIKYKFH